MNTTKLLSLSIAAAIVCLSASRASAMCGDVTGDGRISSSDALSVLREAVGDHHAMMCMPCGETTSTTVDTGATSTTVGDGLFTLQVTKSHMGSSGGMGGGMMNGDGRVISEPAGIDCGQDCSEPFEAQEQITLTAIPDSGDYFIGWWGDVPPECLYDDAACTVTMDRDKTVRAIFMDTQMHR